MAEVSKKPAGPKEAFNELGSSQPARSGGVLTEEYLPELRGMKGRRKFREMAEGHAVVGACLLAIRQYLRRIELTVSPKEGTDERAVELVRTALDDMSQPWTDTMSDILSMLVYGWSLFEVVYKKRVGPDEKDGSKRSQHTDGLIGWRKWAFRPPLTVVEWQFGDDGGLKGVLQQVPPVNRRVELPIDKLLLFRTEAAGNNPEGRSVLRAAYQSYYYAKRIAEIEGIGIERDLAGLPVIGAPPEVVDVNATGPYAETREALKQLTRSIRRDEQEGVLLPLAYDKDGHKLYELSLLSTGGRRQFDTGGVLARYDQRIAMTMLADFILLGHEKVGSFALASSKTDVFALALAGWIDSILDVINRIAIPRLCALNGFDLTATPHLQRGDIDEPDLAALGAYLQALTSSGMTLFPNAELEATLLRAAALPPPDPDERPPAPEAPDVPTPAGGPTPSEDTDVPLTKRGGLARTARPFVRTRRIRTSGVGASRPVAKAYDPDQPRDDAGQWTVDPVSGGNVGSKPGSALTRTDSKLFGGVQVNNVGVRSRIKAAACARIGAKLSEKFTRDEIREAADLLKDPMEDRRYSPEVGDEVVSAIQRSWASTSGDHNAIAVGLQRVAEEVFELNNAELDHLAPRGSPVQTQVFEEKVARIADNRVVHAAVQAIYDDTQAGLREDGVRQLTLVRGMVVSDDVAVPEDRAVPMRGLLQPLSSFSTRLEDATEFGVSGDMDGRGVVMMARVQANRVFSVSTRSGVGCVREHEVVILGGPLAVKAVAVGYDEEHGGVNYRGVRERLLKGIVTIYPDRELHNADWAKRTNDLLPPVAKYDPDQPRDEGGKWTAGGATPAVMVTDDRLSSGTQIVCGKLQDKVVGIIVGAEVPQAHLEELQTIYVDHPRSFRTPNVNAAYNKDTKEIRLNKAPTFHGKPVTPAHDGTIVHEIGHHVFHHRLTDEARQTWQALSNDGQNARISAYAQTNASEHFAEAYSRSHLDNHGRTFLARIEPEVAAYMERIRACDPVFVKGAS